MKKGDLQMHLQDINKSLKLQATNIVDVSEIMGETVYIKLKPQEYIQPCPCCGGSQVIRRGTTGYRKVRHLSICGNKTILKLPKIRMSCNNCTASFTWNYSFIKGKSRYTKIYKEKTSKVVTGSTVAHISKITATPYSSVE